MKTNGAEKTKRNTRFPTFLSATASFVIVVAGMRAASAILVPFLMAVFIAIIITPLFFKLQRLRLPTVVVLLVLILGLVVVTLVGVGAMGQAVNDISRKLPEYQDRLQENVVSGLAWLRARGIEASGPVIEELVNARVAIGTARTMLGAISGLISNTFVILLITIFMLLEAALLPTKVRALPGFSQQDWSRLQQGVSDVRHYMGIKTVTSLATGGLIAGMAAALGLDAPLVLGFLAFFLNYVPNIGSFIAGMPGVLLALVRYGPRMAVVTTIGYLVINVTIGNVIEPRFMGRGLGLSPMVVVLSLVFWGWVLGPVGMLLAVPLTMTVKIALESEESTQGIATLLGGAPRPLEDSSPIPQPVTTVQEAVRSDEIQP